MDTKLIQSVNPILRFDLIFNPITVRISGPQLLFSSILTPPPPLHLKFRHCEKASKFEKKSPACLSFINLSQKFLLLVYLTSLFPILVCSILLVYLIGESTSFTHKNVAYLT